MNRESIAWAAGLFEGEGCITLVRRSWGASEYVYPRLELQMTDEDRVRAFRDAIGFGTVGKPRRNPGKTSWAWRTAQFELVQAAIAYMWPWLGPRRRARARECLLAHTPGSRKYGPWRNVANQAAGGEATANAAGASSPGPRPLPRSPLGET